MRPASASLIRIIAITLGMVVATVVAGWVGVAVLAGACGIASPRLRVRPLAIGVGASASWGLMLAAQAVLGPLGALAAVLGGVLGVPGFVPVLLTILLPFLIAWPAACLGSELSRVARRARREPTFEPVERERAGATNRSTPS